MTRRALGAVVAAVAVLGLAACGGSSSSNSSGTPSTGGSSDLAKQCPTDALAKATKPVKITYWHAMERANEDALKKITKEFNASQSDVQVTLVNQGGYNDALTKFRSVAGTSDAPDLLQIEDTATQQLIDSQAIVPAQACLEAAKSDLSDVLPRVLAYYTVGNVLYPMPFNVSNPVFYYNKIAFRKAGLDPEKPPTTWDELTTDAKKIQAAGYKYGFYYKRDPWVLEQFLALNGEPYVNNGNGRERRATAVTFDTPTARKLFEQLHTLVATKVAATNSASGPSGFDNLTSICQGDNAMTIDTSAALGTVTQVLGTGGCPAKIEVGVAPLPGGNGQGGTLVGGAANYIAKGSDPAKVAAAYRFAQYLTKADVQAEWAAATGYIPISKAAAQSKVMTDLWAKTPGYKVAYDQILDGKDNVATAGPVIGDYEGVRNAMTDALESFLVGSTAPDAALTRAKQKADAAISAYNARVG